jgi:hypothetical protein
VAIASVIRQENEYRLGLVVRVNLFLDTLREGRCSVRRACKISGLNRTLSENLRLRVPIFDQIWSEINAEVTDELEQAAFTRAINGVARDVYYQGVVCGQETHFSDSLLSMLLQGRRPEVYKNRSETHHTGKLTSDEDPRKLTDDELQQLIDDRTNVLNPVPRGA